MKSHLVRAVVGLGLVAASAAHGQAVQWRVEDGGNGHWYQLSSGTASFDAARTSALSVGGNLVTMSSAMENGFVYSNVVSSGLSAGGHAWIGAVSAQGQCANPVGYLWVTGQAFTYQAWAPGYPVTGSSCAASFSPSFVAMWVNRPRTEMANYVIEWSGDCNNDGIVDYGQILSGELQDANSDGIPDCCQEGGGCACPAGDCNGNGICDDLELDFEGNDCNGNRILDKCEIAAGAPDCNMNGVLDSCEIASGAAPDCDMNGVPDSCDIASGAAPDCNMNGVPDSCDIAANVSRDCNSNGIPDECDIASGSELDCNGNGIPDSCDIASGVSGDCNGNGIPDECDIASGFDPDPEGDGIPNSCEERSSIKLIGPGKTGADKCLETGDEILVRVQIYNPFIRVDAAQFDVRWDMDALSLTGIDVGDEPLDQIPLTIIEKEQGRVFWISSVGAGEVGGLQDVRAATLRFTVVGYFEDCEPQSSVWFDPANPPVLVANGQGTSDAMPTFDVLPFRIDNVGPTMTDVPADLTVPADAGAGCFAARDIGSPKVSDPCGSGSTTLMAERSDMQPMTAPWPCGQTTVTWTATDGCGRATVAQTVVTVENNHQFAFMVAYDGTGFAPTMDRCIDFVVGDFEFSQVLTFVDGVAMGTFQLPVGIYSCVTADDDLHSLVSRTDVIISGTQYTAMFAGNAALQAGDLNDDNLVDVVDWAILITRVGESAAVNTDCSTSLFHADIDGDGLVTVLDGDYILDNINESGSAGCAAPSGMAELSVANVLPRPSMTVSDLTGIVGPRAVQADLNRDGVIDAKDIRSWQRMRHAPVAPATRASKGR